jgi:hypothetical protein
VNAIDVINFSVNQKIPSYFHNNDINLHIQSAISGLCENWEHPSLPPKQKQTSGAVCQQLLLSNSFSLYYGIGLEFLDPSADVAQSNPTVR